MEARALRPHDGMQASEAAPLRQRTPRRSLRPRSFRTGLASVLDAVGAVDAAFAARRVVRLPFLPILTYHRVRNGEGVGCFDDDVVDATAERFEAHVRTLVDAFHLVTARELADHVRGERELPANPAMITFDDGYRECRDVVLPILERHGARATFFVATSFVAERRLFWWDAISYLVKATRRSSLALEYPTPIRCAVAPEDRSCAVEALLRVVKEHVALDVPRFVDEVARACDVRWSREREKELAEDLVLTWDDVRALAAAGMDVQSHTRTHRILQTVPPGELDAELAGSRADLEANLGRAVEAIAYPVGVAIADDPALCAAVGRAGYRLGMSNASGTNVLANGLHPFGVRRFPAPGELPESYFRAAMAFPSLAHRRPSPAPRAPGGSRATTSRDLIVEARDLAALADEWRALCARSATDEPTLGPEWMTTWWRVFGHDGDRALRVLTVREGGRLVGVVPLLARTIRYRPGIAFRRLELLASGEDEHDEICSDYIGPIADRDHEPLVADAFADAVTQGELGSWEEVVMPAMNGASLLPSLVASALRARGVDVSLGASAWCPYVPLAGLSSFDEYLAALPSSRRYLVRRSLRAYEKWAGSPAEISFARTERDVRTARAALVRLHEERWAAAGRSGVFSSPRFREFHDAMTAKLFAAGALDVGVLEARGEPLAAVYNIVWDGKSYFYQSGRRVDVPGSVRLGIVVHACVIRDAIARGLREYDFLAGTSRYKLQLALARRPLVTLRATRPSLAEVARRATELVIAQARRLRRQIRAREQPATASEAGGEAA